MVGIIQSGGILGSSKIWVEFFQKGYFLARCDSFPAFCGVVEREMREAPTFLVPMGLRRVVSIVRAEENYGKVVFDGNRCRRRVLGCSVGRRRWFN